MLPAMLEGVERMVQEEANCTDIIRQIQAVQAALNKVNNLILDDHMHSCVTTAISADNLAERERVLHEVTSVIEMAIKL
jgi:CsoR family transcriptional regulator, copper-sensing transcriptional repressor